MYIIVKALAGILVTVPSNAFPDGLLGQSLPPVFLCTLSALVYIHCTILQYTVLVRRQLYFIRYTNEENNENANLRADQ